jgi:hypothetical protein
LARGRVFVCGARPCTRPRRVSGRHISPMPSTHRGSSKRQHTINECRVHPLASKAATHHPMHLACSNWHLHLHSAMHSMRHYCSSNDHNVHSMNTWLLLSIHASIHARHDPTCNLAQALSGTPPLHLAHAQSSLQRQLRHKIERFWTLRVSRVFVGPSSVCDVSALFAPGPLSSSSSSRVMSSGRMF